jgi:hypothetical protein
MVTLPQVTEFVHNYIVQHPVRGNDSPPVELNPSDGTSTAPSGFERFDANVGGRQPDNTVIRLGFLSELLLCIRPVPVREGPPDPFWANPSIRQRYPTLSPNCLTDVFRMCFDLQ